MLDDRRQRHRMRARDVADGKLRRGSELGQDSPAGRIGKRGEGLVERIGRKLNHVV